jgi:hypothetical protein
VDFQNGAGKDGDRLYVYYAGHGISAPGAQAKWTDEPLLVPSNVRDIAISGTRFIGFTWILESLVSAKPREQVFFFDACRDFALKNYAPPVGMQVGPKISAKRGESTQYVLYATSVGGQAQEMGAGIFGKALLRGLRGDPGAARYARDEFPPVYQVLFDDLAEFVKNKVTTQVEDQKPRAKTEPGTPDLVLATIAPQDMPQVELDVRVEPSEALETCSIEVLYPPPPNGQASRYGDPYPPPAVYPTKIKLPPDAFYIQAQSPSYESDIKAWSQNKPSIVNLVLKAKKAAGELRALGAELSPADGQGLSFDDILKVRFGESALERKPSHEALEGILGRDDRLLEESPLPTLGQLPMGRLDITSNDRMAAIQVWGPGRHLVGSGTGQLSVSDLPIGSYRVVLGLPDGPTHEQIVEVEPNETTRLELTSPAPQLGDEQLKMLAELNIELDEKGYLYPSPDLGGIARAKLASLLGLAAYVSQNPRVGEATGLGKFGVHSMNDLPVGAAGVLVLLGVSGTGSMTDAEQQDFLVGGKVRVLSNKEGAEEVSDEFQRLEGFPAASQSRMQIPAGSGRIVLHLPGLINTTYATVGVPDRVTVLVVVAQGSGQFEVQQYLLALPGREGVGEMEWLEGIRRLELAQRYYANDKAVPDDAMLSDMLQGKWLNPLLGCIAGYSWVRAGMQEKYRGHPLPDEAMRPGVHGPSAMQNMLYYFGDVPDSHVLAGLCEPERRDEHFANALEKGVPIFYDGFKALHEWAAKTLHPVPEALEVPARGLLPGSPWTAWSPSRPALQFKRGQIETIPPGWSILEEKRQEIERAGRAIALIQATGGNASSQSIGTTFLVGDDLVLYLEFGSGSPDRPFLTGGSSLLLDFANTPARARSEEFEVKEKLGTIQWKVKNPPDGQVAGYYHLLRVARKSSSGKSLPKPLLLASKAPASVKGRSVCVISYPFEDARVDRSIRDEAFAQRYGVKRLQPGLVIGSPAKGRVLNHDCFTLGGSAGAPVIDLETMQVIAIHVGGRANYNGYYKFNMAVSMWTLADEPLLKEAGVNFAPR